MAVTTKQCEDFWRVADTNGDGELTIQELEKAVRKYSPGVSDAEIAGMFSGVDEDENQKMSKREFIYQLTEREKRAAAIDKLFKQYDKNNSKTLDMGEFIQMVKDCFPPEQVDSIVGQFLNYSDFDKDGLISYEELRKYFG